MSGYTRLSEAQLSAALSGDTEAAAGVLRALDGLIGARARRIDRGTAEDLAQVGREAVWLALSRFAGSSAGGFVVFADRTATGAMKAAYCELRWPGIPLDQAKLWRSALKHADGSEDDAERLLCSGELSWRMSPKTAKWIRSAVAPPEVLPETLCANPPSVPSAAAVARASALLATLAPQQRAVVEMSFGIGDSARLSDSEIADALGLARTRIPPIRHKALARLRDRARHSFLLG